MSDDELTPEQKFAAEDPEVLVTRGLNAGRSVDEIVRSLVQLDWTPDAARSLVARIEHELRAYHASPAGRQFLRRQALAMLGGGILLSIVVVAISVVSFLATAAGVASVYVILVGALLAGMTMASMGWTRLRIYRSEDLKHASSSHLGAFPVQQTGDVPRNDLPA